MRWLILPSTLAVGFLAAFGLSGCEDVTVQALHVVSVSIEPPEIVLIEGDSAEMRAVARSADGEVLEGRTIAWTSDDPSIARIGASSTVTAVSPGTTSVRGAVEGIEGGANVTVPEGPGLGVSPTSLRVSANPRGVTPGTYGATVLVSEPGQVALEVGFQVSGAAAAAEDEAP